MSVTFDVTVSEEDIVSHDIHCYATEYGDNPEDGHGHKSFATWDECKEAFMAGVSVGTVSRDCCTTTKGFSFDSSQVAVNMSNSNAIEMLTMLGFVIEGEELPYCGNVGTDDLRGRITADRHNLLSTGRKGDGLPVAALLQAPYGDHAAFGQTGAAQGPQIPGPEVDWLQVFDTNQGSPVGKRLLNNVFSRLLFKQHW